MLIVEVYLWRTQYFTDASCFDDVVILTDDGAWANQRHPQHRGSTTSWSIC